MPHYKLPLVKMLVKAGKVRATASAYAGALEPGIEDMAGMCDVVLFLSRKDFYKSMTTQANTAMGHEACLKLTVIDDVVIVSFKDLRA